MQSTLWIGYYSFLEAVRNRLLLGILVMVLPLFFTAWMLDVYHLDLQVKFVKDIGLNVISGFGLLIVVILSLDQLIPDLERKTIYFILTRMPSRQKYLLGRFFGVSASLAFYHLLTGGAIFLFLRAYFGAWFWELPVGAFIIFLKQAVLIAVILFLSTWLSKIVILSLGTLIYVLGHFIDVFRMWADRKGNALLSMVIEGVAFVLPDFSLFEPRISVVHEIQISLEPFLFVTVYATFISLFYLGIGGWILSRRDL
jgi:ABC-type transport system involved in multi-copper enzyme maturation permease subunit